MPPRPIGSPSIWSSRTPTSSSRSTTVTSRSTRISSASSDAPPRRARAGGEPSVADGLTLRELADRRVTELRAVGPKLAAGLAEMGVTSALDLLDHYPRRYVDRTQRAEIAELAIGDEATVD